MSSYEKLLRKRGYTISPEAVERLQRDCEEAGLIDISEPPVPELKGALPLVLYFGNDKDRDEFIQLMKQAKPGLATRKL
jgi:hypothetical protein